MSNKRKDGDFNLDEELRSNIVANEEGSPLANDDFEEVVSFEEGLEKSKKSLESKYGIHPHLKRKQELIDSDILLSVRNLKQFFFFGAGINKSKLKAVSNISFDVHSGECFGIVGESGCGKTTTGRSIIKLYDITSGSIYYRGYRISAGKRWNEKEIKFTRIRLKQKLAELSKKQNEMIGKLDPKSPDYSSSVQNIRESIRYEKMAARKFADDIVKTQRKKIEIGRAHV